MTTAPLILSLFPGLDLLGTAFEERGFCVVRGPDLIFGGDVRAFHPPNGAFAGIIGGPPCQLFSPLKRLNPLAGRHGNMIPEFERIVREGQPDFYCMENVTGAPLPELPTYLLQTLTLNNRWLGEEQSRLRRFSIGTALQWLSRSAPRIAVAGVALEAAHTEPCVIGGGYVGKAGAGKAVPWRERARLQGLSAEWITRMQDDGALTVHALQKGIGNGVPLPMGRAIADAIATALYPFLEPGADWRERFPQPAADARARAEA